ncbi:universal stress protein [Celeribacter baekdonensis]|uniref:UspA domain-containing protein n=2 Tax=Rhodobacterales TaxID=204455 RepID=K2JYV2_9RHOB|nr:hypothetical protein B30_13364 [Celeribacter baekdonensis B30]KAB6714922.1 universal stress protein [Roseobacter sp. TSBP12]|tara:strand:- start:3649 stop:4065 length:417 start_codon:yes stop_codon:yes gene_type:complete
MFKKIVVPIDMSHVDRLQKALRVAGNLAQTHDASICYVGVTTPMPSSVAHTPKEFEAKLAAFAEQEAGKYNIKTESHMIVSQDPAVQKDRELEKAISTLGADLVVMATHVPNATDYIWSGHGAHLAAHSDISVMLVRE